MVRRTTQPARRVLRGLRATGRGVRLRAHAGCGQGTLALQESPPLPHARLQPAQLLVGLVENVKLLRAPAPPDSQAPLQIFILKAAHNCVLCHHGSIRENPAERGSLRKPTGVPASSGWRSSPCTFSEDRAWLRGHLCSSAWHQPPASLSGSLACGQSF